MIRVETIPGLAETYPGEAGATTAPLLPARTRDVQWHMPNTGADDTNIVFTVRVTSDQPVVVGANFHFNGFIPANAACCRSSGDNVEQRLLNNEKDTLHKVFLKNQSSTVRCFTKLTRCQGMKKIINV